MAASQARFLGLTARKTNVEFEGQQINQQRTTLANQSANYYNDLLGMSVPTPPSVDMFTKTVYTFNDGALTNQITALIAQGKGAYKVSYLQQYEDDFTPVVEGPAVITKTTKDGFNDIYMVGNTTLRKLSFDIYDKDGNYIADDEYLNSLTDDQRNKLIAEEQAYYPLLNEKYGVPVEGWYVRYVQNTSTGVYEPKFYNADEIMGAEYDTKTGLSKSSITAYKMGSATTTTEVKGEDAKIEQDSTGRYINITLNPEEPNEVTYSLTTSTITDQDAYEDAMNQYEFDKYQYDQAIQEINAKIEIIQAEDKNLELRLKQLDTEQEAIQTEMDAVDKIVQKNVESTFKTFG